MVVKDAFSTEGRKLFVGTEYEGPNTGLTTLFVQGKVPVSLINKALADRQDIEMLYFGAGRLSEYDPEVILGFAGAVPKRGVRARLKVTIESPLSQLALLRSCPKLYHMLTTSMPSRPIAEEGTWDVITAYVKTLSAEQKTRVIVKIDTGTYVVCSTLSMCSINSYAGYANDVLIWEETK